MNRFIPTIVFGRLSCFCLSTSPTRYIQLVSQSLPPLLVLVGDLQADQHPAPPGTHGLTVFVFRDSEHRTFKIIIIIETALLR